MDDENQIRHLHAYIYGKVHGVFFRDSIRKYSQQLNITGCVKNLKDGSVEVCAEGNFDVLKELEVFLYKGPRLAEVEDVKLKYSDDLHNYNSFEIH